MGRGDEGERGRRCGICRMEIESGNKQLAAESMAQWITGLGRKVDIPGSIPGEGPWGGVWTPHHLSLPFAANDFFYLFCQSHTVLSGSHSL